MTAPPDRTRAPAEVAGKTHAIVVGIRYVPNIGGITAVIVEVTKVTGITVAILSLAVG